MIIAAADGDWQICWVVLSAHLEIDHRDTDITKQTGHKCHLCENGDPVLQLGYFLMALELDSRMRGNDVKLHLRLSEESADLLKPPVLNQRQYKSVLRQS